MYRIDIANRDRLTDEDRQALTALRKSCAADIIRMTYLAGCGHPGGSLSTLDLLLMIYATARLDPEAPRHAQRDRVIVSHGHISPGVYSVLGAFDFFERRAAMLRFRLAGSPYSGHVEFGVPGVEWNTGNLGQGLSAGTASAAAARLRDESFRAIVLMGDGEQQKGQISEARRFAVKFGLSNLIGLIDLNKLQIGGKTADIMPQDIAGDYRSAGWNVLEVDGHDLSALYLAWRQAYLAETPEPGRPTVIIARTTMGRGVSFMEGDHHFHGVAPNEQQARDALAELGASDDLAELSAARAELGRILPRSDDEFSARLPSIETGEPRCYELGTRVDCRSGYGNALADLATLNNTEASASEGHVAGVSCDLEGSVKMNKFHEIGPRYFFEVGIQEHHAATFAGRLSWEGFITFYSTFGVFAIAEGYNQQRLNDINHTNLKVVATHCGLDVGEDGPTHQSIDYISVMSGPFGYRIFSPADANQCDRMTRCAAALEGNVFMAMGRSKVPVIEAADGTPFFAGDYEFTPGRADWIRGGQQAVIACYGPTVSLALEAHTLLQADGKDVAVVNFGSLKPFDKEAIRAAADTGAILSVEDHNVNCGLGALIARTLGELGLGCRTRRMGVSCYGSSGKATDLFAEQGMTPQGIRQAVLELLG